MPWWTYLVDRVDESDASGSAYTIAARLDSRIREGPGACSPCSCVARFHFSKIQRGEGDDLRHRTYRKCRPRLNKIRRVDPNGVLKIRRSGEMEYSIVS